MRGRRKAGSGGTQFGRPWTMLRSGLTSSVPAQMRHSCHRVTSPEICRALILGSCSISKSTHDKKESARWWKLSHPTLCNLIEISLYRVPEESEAPDFCVPSTITNSGLAFPLLPHHHACSFPHLCCPPKTKLDLEQGIF